MTWQRTACILCECNWGLEVELDGGHFTRIRDLVAELQALLASSPATPDPAYPFVLTAGERRSLTANTIIRDPSWRK